jgi:hypothetical protein
LVYRSVQIADTFITPAECLGFRDQFARFLDDRLSIIVVMNLDDVDIDSICRGIADLYLPSPRPAEAR